MKKINSIEMRKTNGGAYPIGTVKGTCLTCGQTFYSTWVFGYTAYSNALKKVIEKGNAHVKKYKSAFGCYGWKTKML